MARLSACRLFSSASQNHFGVVDRADRCFRRMARSSTPIPLGSVAAHVHWGILQPSSLAVPADAQFLSIPGMTCVNLLPNNADCANDMSNKERNLCLNGSTSTLQAVGPSRLLLPP